MKAPLGKTLNTTTIKSKIEQLPFFTPQQLFNKVNELGYIGQENARKALCLMAFRHINKLRKIHLDDVSQENFPTKENCLLIGPTGSGKTFLVETLFNKILTLPVIIEDISKYVDTGYLGEYVSAILPKLINKTNRDKEMAQFGIVVLDEFDKIAASSSGNLYGGGGTNKDVSGMGVQQELLKIMESGNVPTATNGQNFNSTMSGNNQVDFSTANIPFVCCGAFSGLQNLVFKDTQGAEMQALTEEDIQDISIFKMYGMMPELMGRFSRIVSLKQLTLDDLKSICKCNTLPSFEKELALEGVKLQIDENLIDGIVHQAIHRGTGARGVKSSLEYYLEDAIFNLYSRDRTKKVSTLEVFEKAGEVKWELI
jgi:ATP-dependent Clp protease ATP-binding subunit ClpX